MLLAAGVVPVRAAAAAAACSALSTHALAQGTITSAERVEAGGFAPPNGSAEPFRTLPAFCRVAATLTPSADSEIRIEVWMPVSGWNGKLQAVGNGAFSGAIGYRALATALARGYAASSTDTGHAGGSAAFALGHPEKLIDFGWRAVHELATTSKAIVSAYYDGPPRSSFWNGCSAGGRQGMKAAQQFPADFDGIIAGSPALDWTSRATQAVRLAAALEANPAARLRPDQLPPLHRAAVAACDRLDGLEDGLIGDPERCTFDASALQCREGSADTCLSPPQLATVRSIYASPPNPKTGRPVTGLARGSGLGWTELGWTASARATGLDHFRFIVFKRPEWILPLFNFDADVVRAEEVDNGTINALDPNLKPFIDRGGKLIQYHGWSDPQISPGNSTQYYSRVADTLGAAAIRDSYRLFMAPGMAHCSGGEGPNTFDMVSALEQWVEHNQPPARIIAAHATGGAVDRTRPLCPYPQQAVYTGSGSVNDAAMFECRLVR